MLALLLGAPALGLSNFAASVGLGASGVDRRTRLRVGLVFGFFETAMPIIGLLAGRGAAGALGAAPRVVRGAPAHRHRPLRSGPGPATPPRRSRRRAAIARAFA